ncbi:ComEC/Rec2 family competence protein [Bartonella sp. DGB1]|uniref:ComEC/Rec2 family competence protein n=1 Tax=Bartonella sp. DGB1 TaxID=3239807 RepID=UPI0035258251
MQAPDPLNKIKYVEDKINIVAKILNFINTIKNLFILEYSYGTYFNWIPVFFAIGILLYYHIDLELQLTSLILLNLLIGTLMVFINKNKFLLILVSYIFFIILGMTCAKLETIRLNTNMIPSAITTHIIAKVEQINLVKNNNYRLILATQDTSQPKLSYVPQKIQVKLNELIRDLQIGDKLSGKIRLSPFNGAERLSGFNFSFSQYFNSIGAQGVFLNKPILIKHKDNLTLSNKFMQYVEQVRFNLSHRIYEVLPGEKGAIAAALITGKRGGISEETNYNLRRSGLAHILAISGLHMSLVVGLILVLFRYIFALFPVFTSHYSIRKMVAIPALMVAFLYLLLSGISVAAFRSFLMVCVILLAMLCGRQALTIRNLSIAALVILIFSPHEILNAGFQLSFGATLILLASINWIDLSKLYATKRIAKFYRILWNYILIPILAIAITSFVIGFASGIYSLYHFDNIAIWGVVSNILVFPIITLIIMPSALIASLLVPFGMDYYIFKLMGWGIEYVIMVANWVSSWSYKNSFGYMPVSTLIFSTLGLLCLCGFRTKLAVVSIVFFILAAVSFYFKKIPHIIIIKNNLVMILDKRAISINKNNSANKLRIKNFIQLYKIDQLLPPLTTDYLAQYGQFMCKKGLCVAVLKNGDIITVAENNGSAKAACELGDIVILNYKGYHNRCYNKSSLVINSYDLARWGTAIININGNNYDVKYTDGSISRPWNKHKKFISFD